MGTVLPIYNFFKLKSRQKIFRLFSFLMFMLFISTSVSYGQLGSDTFSIASDATGNYNATSPWIDGSNQGSGFNNWTLSS